MSDRESSEDSCDEEKYSLSLLDLPVEIILHICSFLDAASLVHGLGSTCKHFYYILNDNSFWKMRINRVYPDANYPISPAVEEDDLFWKLSCISIERHLSLWKQENAMEKLSLKDVHFSTIDGLLLMHDGNICISGGRDRTLVTWNLPREENKCPKSEAVNDAHEGWIWDLTAIDDTVYSCGWDRTVKAWELTSTGLAHLKTYEMNVSGALLCVSSCPELAVFATGSFCKTVLVYDPRAGDSPISRYKPHQRAVIRLAMSSNFILSGSEDKTVAIWDQRAGRIMNPVTISKESFPMSMCMQKNLVYIGDSVGKLHVLDEKKNFQPVKCYATEHEKGITGVHVNSGCLITSSLDKTVQISGPTDPPKALRTLNSSHGEIARIDYLNEVLAVSGTDTIEVWRPMAAQMCSC